MITLTYSSYKSQTVINVCSYFSNSSTFAVKKKPISSHESLFCYINTEVSKTAVLCLRLTYHQNYILVSVKTKSILKSINFLN